ncbi:formate dehydrogenase accessory protein FdhE [Pseudomonas stutzeri]|uniref:Protein FdhE homolog n=1 Tax=Stutzerimonas stutzeri TaxID=316 RepID=A0A2N8RXH5_STUST|nr:formate dehydrogenase accessory protein FdhE [Stutzerimonas stutzeri]MCQ4297189.1 formate dehydrogenase accessory protein FdhE [Stutzerimonas stutzeri]PNF79063.1 formate dehydrogenase accessory protein FdhE [Stutzerimonas stutzeri]
MAGTILEPGQIEAAASKPPFLNLPPRDLFALRSERLAKLADGHPFADYLRLLAAVCQAQQQVLDIHLAELPVDAHRTRECFKHDLPPLAADTLVREDGWLALLDAWLDAFVVPDNPAVVGAIEQLREADSGQRKAWAVGLVSGQYDIVPPALVPFLGAALQVAWSHWLLQLDLSDLREREDQTLCPCCGAPPMAGIIRHRGQLNGLRYLVCSLCACEWHYVRVKCSLCRSTKKLDYLHLEGAPQGVKAEVCPECNGYLKQLYLELAPDGESLSADLATLELDLLLAEQGFQRQAPNLLLAPGGDA